MAESEASAAGRIPVIRAAVAPLGLALGAVGQAGGGSEPTGVCVPLVEVRWFDERQTCRLVQDQVDQERAGLGDQLPAFEGCYSYSGGECALRAPGCVCAFLEGPSAEVWHRARRWKRDAAGGLWDETVWALMPQAGGA